MRRVALIIIFTVLLSTLVFSQGLEETQELINIITQERSYLPRIEQATSEEQLDAIRSEIDQNDIDSDVLDAALSYQQKQIAPGFFSSNATNLGIGAVILAVLVFIFLTSRKMFKKDAAQRALEHVHRKLKLAQQYLKESSVLTRKEESVEERTRHYAALFAAIGKRSKPIEDLLQLSRERFEDNLDKFSKEYLQIAQNDPHLIALIKEMKTRWDASQGTHNTPHLLREIFSDPSQNIKRIEEIYKEIEPLVQEQREDFKERSEEHAHHLSALAPLPEGIVRNNRVTNKDAISLLQQTHHTTLLGLLQQKREVLSQLWTHLKDDPLPIAQRQLVSTYLEQVQQGGRAEQLAQDINNVANTFESQVKEEIELWDKLSSLEGAITLEYANASKREASEQPIPAPEEDKELTNIIRQQEAFNKILKQDYTPEYYQQLQHLLNVSYKPSLLIERLRALQPRIATLEEQQRKRVEKTVNRIVKWVKGDFITGELVIRNAPQGIQVSLHDKHSSQQYDLDQAGERFVYHDVIEGSYQLMVEHEGGIRITLDMRIPPQRPINIDYAQVTGRGTQRQREEAMSRVSRVFQRVAELKQQERITQEREDELKERLHQAQDRITDEEMLSKTSSPLDYEEIASAAEQEVEEAEAEQPLTLAQRLIENAQQVDTLLNLPHTVKREQELKQVIGSDDETIKDLLKALKKDPYKKRITPYIEAIRTWSKRKEAEVRIHVTSPVSLPAARADFWGKGGMVLRAELQNGTGIIGLPRGDYDLVLYCRQADTLVSCRNKLRVSVINDMSLELRTDGITFNQA